MARSRLPQAKAEASGAMLQNPARFANRKSPKRTRPIGEPYARMSEGERWFWEEFRAELPWLHSGNRVLLLAACRLAYRLDTDPDFGVSGIQALSAILSKLGATPVDETKVNHGDGDGEDDSDRFFARSH